jgi:hypothetical protein
MNMVTTNCKIVPNYLTDYGLSMNEQNSNLLVHSADRKTSDLSTNLVLQKLIDLFSESLLLIRC